MYFYFLFPIAAIYVAAIFPILYFRHDDWLILGNSVLLLPKDLSFLWKPNIFYAKLETIWFLRPFFKGITYLYYQWFELNYSSWLFLNLIFFCLALYFSYQAVLVITALPRKADLFSSLFLGMTLFHFGSLTWAGEGLMNCPQLLLLSLTTLLFVKGFESSGWLYSTAALIAFVLSFGFKESSVFHSLFLSLILWLEPRYNGISFRKKVLALGPYLTFSFIYTYYRLFFVPLHPSYIPIWKWFAFSRPLLIFGGLLAGLYLLSRLLNATAKPNHSHKIIVIFGFIALSCVPYFGHGFFSLGWLLLFGFYLSFLFCFLFEPTSQKKISYQYIALLLVSSVALAQYVKNEKWVDWKIGQREIVEFFAKATSIKTKQVVILDCHYQTPFRFERIVTFEAGLYFLWKLTHRSEVPIGIYSCEHPPTITSVKNALILRWEFPHLQRIYAKEDGYVAQF